MMKRKPTSYRPIAVIASDLHLRMDAPRCRDEREFIAAQEHKFASMIGRAALLGVPILVSGDVFHRPRPAQWAKLLLWTSKWMKKAPAWIVIPGNHDLPNASLDRLGESALGVLAEIMEGRMTMGRVALGEFFHLRLTDNTEVALTHTYLHPPGEDRFWAREKGTIIGNYDGPAKVVITGDNHLSFHARDDKGRLWLNPGTMMRQNVSEAEYTPQYYILEEDEHGRVRALPQSFSTTDASSVFLRHSDSFLKDNPRVAEFIRKIQADYQYNPISLESVIRNIEADPKIKEHILTALEEVLVNQKGD